MMIPYPNINPIIISLGKISIHWYGVMYIISFFIIWILSIFRISQKNVFFIEKQEIIDILFYAAIGILIGGRLGYILFYSWQGFLNNPFIIYKIWLGGMSFHGGLIGTIVSFGIYSYKKKCRFIYLTDFFAPMAPIGIIGGRLGNFINGELWGKVTNLPIGMIFPKAGPLPRYPSQLIEMFLEGVILFIFLWIYSKKKRPTMTISLLFLIGYGIMRFIAEFFRQPDAQLGYIAFGWMTQGQLLCIPMILIGFFLFFYVDFRN